MNRPKAFEQTVETLKEFGEVSVWCNSGEQYVIEPANNFIGGDEDCFMSSHRG